MRLMNFGKKVCGELPLSTRSERHQGGGFWALQKWSSKPHKVRQNLRKGTVKGRLMINQ